MKNKQIEIILSSVEKNEIYDYVVDTFYHPIKQIKDTIARGLKGIKEPIADEDLSTLKSSFMKFEMEIDRNLDKELSILASVLNQQAIDNEKTAQVVKALEKEKRIVSQIHAILDQSKATCQVYDLLKQVLYKSEDRVDVLEHFIQGN